MMSNVAASRLPTALVHEFTVTSEEKVQTNIRLTPTARKLLVRIASFWGVAQGDVIEILLRAEAARLGFAGFKKVDPPYPGADERR